MRKELKMELFGAAATLLISVVALVSAAYAWYVTNNVVEAETSKVSATTNGFILQISDRQNGAQHGGDSMSLVASAVGDRLAPSSTANLKDWYVCRGLNEQGKVTSYQKVSIQEGTGAKPGAYKIGDKTLFAYSKSEFVVYTINQTGKADVYFDGSEGAPITVAIDNDKTASSNTIRDSIRVAITTQGLDNAGNTIGEEQLKVVYAPTHVTGKGNDNEAKEGWTCIEDGSKPVSVKYLHFASTDLKDNEGNSWIIKKDSGDFIVNLGTRKIAENVGYDGILLNVYIWMEGTDADCVNNAVEQDEATYSVTVRLAGVNS